jgi:hypothetical protein
VSTPGPPGQDGGVIGMSEQEWVDELALRLQEEVLEQFSRECKAEGREMNVAVVAGALVRAGTQVMCRFCPQEKVPEGAQSLVLQISAALREWKPLPPSGEAANDGVEGEEGPESSGPQAA